MIDYFIGEFKRFKLKIDSQDYLGFTPLLLSKGILENSFYMLACNRCYDQDESEAVAGRIVIVKALVEAGANVNFAKRGTELTPLHWAAFNND